MMVKLVRHTPEPERTVAMSARLCYSPIGAAQLEEKISDEQAANLSGGQKQRLCIARALLHDSALYIFDEATSNIDVESENKIMEVLYELSKEKLVLCISHRLANLIHADAIYCLKDGDIVESGTHEELLQQNGVYRDLFNTQKELERYGA